MNENKQTVITIAVIMALLFLFLGAWDKFSAPSDIEFTHFGKIVDMLEEDDGIIFLASIDNMQSVGLIPIITTASARIIGPQGTLRKHELIGKRISILGEEENLNDELVIIAEVIFAR